MDHIWGDSRPPRPKESVKTLPLEFTGKQFEEKIEDLRKELEKKKSAGLIVCMGSRSFPFHQRRFTNSISAMLDEVAWLYNLRGNEYAD